MNPDNAGNYDNCKERCVASNDCGGIAIIDEKCYLKGTECKNNFKLESASGTRFLQKKVD